MRKFVCATVVTVCVLSVAMAEDVRGRITKIDGDKITIVSGKKGEEPKTTTATLTANTKFVKGKFNKAEKKFEPGDAITGGKTTLSTMLDKAGKKGVGALVTVENGKATQVLILGGKGRKKKTDN
jgi:hypothetical protein